MVPSINEPSSPLIVGPQLEEKHWNNKGKDFIVGMKLTNETNHVRFESTNCQVSSPPFYLGSGLGVYYARSENSLFKKDGIVYVELSVEFLYSFVMN